MKDLETPAVILNKFFSNVVAQIWPGRRVSGPDLARTGSGPETFAGEMFAPPPPLLPLEISTE